MELISIRKTPKGGQFFFDRLGRFMMGLGNIIDGMVAILSGGVLYGGFAYEMMWKVMKYRSKEERCVLDNGICSNSSKVTV